MISFCLKTLPGLRVEIPVTLSTFNQTTSNLSAIYQSAEERSIIMLSTTEANFVTKSSSTLTSSSIPVPSQPTPRTFVPRYNNLVNGLEIYFLYIQNIYICSVVLFLCVYLLLYILLFVFFFCCFLLYTTTSMSVIIFQTFVFYILQSRNRKRSHLFDNWQETYAHSAFFYVELLCNVWFIIELTIRSVVS